MSVRIVRILIYLIYIDANYTEIEEKGEGGRMNNFIIGIVIITTLVSALLVYKINIIYKRIKDNQKRRSEEFDEFVESTFKGMGAGFKVVEINASNLKVSGGGGLS